VGEYAGNTIVLVNMTQKRLTRRKMEENDQFDSIIYVFEAVSR